MAPTLRQLIYTSAANQTFSSAELKALLESARKKNTAAELTGLLLHERGSFLQVLEGSQAAIDELYEKLLKDPRHHHLVRVYEGPIDARHFGDWSMGFAAVPKDQAAHIAGYNDFFAHYHATGEAPGSDLARRILGAFSEGRWHACVEK